ncbi:MAG: hypothetical protein NE327_03680 [Lentisphaeraceae bacterium]|nr:hypothetical protein [Lentisphaeraceae bacterium]
MRNMLFTLLVLFCFIAEGQDAIELQLDELFIENANDDIIIEDTTTNIEVINSWGKDETNSSFLHMKNRLATVKGPVFLFIVDGGDLYEADNLIKFMNSNEGRSFRSFTNYLVLDSREIAESKTLSKKFENGNLFMLENDFSILAQTTVDFYQTKTGIDWWKRIKLFVSKNNAAVQKVSLRIRSELGEELVKRFDDSIYKIKNASFRERKKAIATMKSLVKEMGFLLFPETINPDPEVSLTADKLLLGKRTKLDFPVVRKVPSWFDLEKQMALLSKK